MPLIKSGITRAGGVRTAAKERSPFFIDLAQKSDFVLTQQRPTLGEFCLSVCFFVHCQYG